MGIYGNLGLRPLINADARLTRLGGSIMPRPVVEAMAEASRNYVDMFALQRAVGRRLAELTHNEAAFVCAGAAAGLVLSTLACVTGSDMLRIARRFDMPEPRPEVLVHRAQRIPYDPAITLAGARLVEIGNALQTFPWEFEAAVTERTVAVLYIAGEHLSRGALSLPETIALAHRHGLPVIVDAAAQLPPPENLWRFTRDLGADLAVFSGGKDLRGPQTSGLIVGRADLIAACAEHGAPHQRLGRPMKVGKEEMIGLLTAVELYLSQDHAERQTGFETIVEDWRAALADLPGVTARRDFPNEAGQPVPRLLIELDPAAAGLTGADLRERVLTGEPAIAVGRINDRAISITPDTLEPGEEIIVADQIRRVLLAARSPALV